MNAGLIDKEVNETIRVMKHTHGKDIYMYDDSFIEKSLEKRWATIGVENAVAYIRYLEENRAEADTFHISLNNNHSEFFRNSLTFAVLEQCVLPKLISQKPNGSEIRVWSAGCSAGQEAYSIAILLDSIVAASGKAIRFRIFATDTSQVMLNLAKDGIYDKDSVQNLKLIYLQKYFTKFGESYMINSRLRDSINFYSYDLLDKLSMTPPESIYGEFDIVFCCNLLFYYKPDIRQFILQKLLKSMSTMGYLVTGEAERMMVEKLDKLQMVAPPAAVFQIR